jgi:ribosomal protein S27E
VPRQPRPIGANPADYLVVHCQRCDAALHILVARKSHPLFCDECAAILAEALAEHEASKGAANGA